MARFRTRAALALVCAALAAAPAAAATDEPLPRVEDALCPGVMGIATDSALQILDRVRYNAERLGIALGDPEDCKLNLVIAFVDDGQDFVGSLMHSEPRLFETLTLTEKQQLREARGPALAWNIVATRTRDGMIVTRRENLTQIPQASMWSAHSKIYTATRQDIVSSVVVFSGRQVSGMTTTQLADYASMRSFAADYAAHPGRQGTILALFEDGSSRPAELTETDLSFLKTLYSGIANLPGRAKQRSIEQELGEG